MGGIVNSVGGFLGLGSGPKAPVSTANSALDQVNKQNSLYSDPAAMQALQDYQAGKITPDQVLNSVSDPGMKAEMQNALATGAGTGSMFATQQVQNNPILGQLFGNGGELTKSIGKEQELQNQGFKIQPQDVEAYGQASGDIARMFGQSENSLANSLANRGLASAPSGSAGAQFSGLQGNKNEQLAKAQMDIANQRMQNTMQRIGQQQQFIGQLGSQGANAINQQYGRQLEGANYQKGGLNAAAGLNTSQNQTANAANLGAANFEQENKPANLFDMAQGALGSAAGSAGTTIGQKGGAKAATGLFGA